MSSRREFLGHVFNAGTAGVAFPLLANGSFIECDPFALPKLGARYDEHYAKRLHDRVMAAFDFGAGLPVELWDRTGISFRATSAELPWRLVILQNRVPTLRRGQAYAIITELHVERGDVRIIAGVVPNSPFVLGSSFFLDRVNDYRSWRLVTMRHLA